MNSKAPKKQDEKLNLGAPIGAPKYYYIKKLVDRNWVYFDKSGKETDIETVKRSKRKVYAYSAASDKIVIKAKKKPKKTRKKPQGKEVLLTSELYGYEVISKVTFNAANNRKNFFIFKGDTYEVTKQSTADFCLFFNEVHGEFFDKFNDLIPSPMLVLGYIEFKKNSIIDFDTIDVKSGNSELEGMDAKELAEEFEEIAQAVSAFKAFITRKIKTYFFS